MPRQVALLYVQSQSPSLLRPSLQLSYADAKQVVTFITGADTAAWAKGALEPYAADRVTVQPLQGSAFIQLILTVDPKQSITFDTLLNKLAPIFVTSHREYVYSSQPLNPKRVEFTIRTPENNSPQIALQVRRGDRLFSMEVLRPWVQATIRSGLHLSFGGSTADGWYYFTPTRQLPADFRVTLLAKYTEFDSVFYKQQ